MKLDYFVKFVSDTQMITKSSPTEHPTTISKHGCKPNWNTNRGDTTTRGCSTRPSNPLQVGGCNIEAVPNYGNGCSRKIAWLKNWWRRLSSSMPFGSSWKIMKYRFRHCRRLRYRRGWRTVHVCGPGVREELSQHVPVGNAAPEESGGVRAGR